MLFDHLVGAHSRVPERVESLHGRKVLYFHPGLETGIVEVVGEGIERLFKGVQEVLGIVYRQWRVELTSLPMTFGRVLRDR